MNENEIFIAIKRLFQTMLYVLHFILFLHIPNCYSLTYSNQQKGDSALLCTCSVYTSIPTGFKIVTKVVDK